MIDTLGQIGAWLMVFAAVGGIAAFNLRRDEVKRRKRMRARSVRTRW